MHTHLLSRPSIDSLKNTQFDLAVIGGGITGAGVAQDAAARGLRVVVFEKSDFAAGTSSKSTKLIHGGLRYLKNGQVGVVRESLRERQLQMKLAPHMVWSVPFVVPTYRGNLFKNFTLSLGLWAYDLLAGFRNRKFHKRISREEVLARCPGVRAEGLTGGFLYEDARTDDARHTLDVLKSAHEHGAVVVNYARVVGIRNAGSQPHAGSAGFQPAPDSGSARILRAPTSDKLTGLTISMRDAHGKWSEPFEVRAHAVVNATGVWTGKVGTALGIKSKTIVVPAKGIHITVDPRTLPIKSAMIIPSVRGDDRFCFAVPWYDSIVIGTTDTEYNGDLDDVRAEQDEIQYVLDAVNAMFSTAKLTPSEVTGSYAGLRPLIKDPSKNSTADLSRGHSLDVASNGLISIAGGKLTTYRPMAESVVDVVCKRLLAAGDVRKVGPKITHTLRLGGWKADQDARRGMLGMWQDALQYRLGEETAGYLVTAYGRRTLEVLDLARTNRALARRIAPNHPYIMAQVWYAVTAEGAMTIDDVLSRRIRLSITDGTAALKAAEPVSHLMAQLLGWSSETRAAQVEEFRERLGA